MLRQRVFIWENSRSFSQPPTPQTIRTRHRSAAHDRHVNGSATIGLLRLLYALNTDYSSI